MSVALADLVTRLQNDVPARGGTPSGGQYEQAVKDAVLDYSLRRPMEKVTTLPIVSGTADYALPADFARLISLTGLAGDDGVLNTSDGLIPVSATCEEYWTIAGATLTFHPTPSYSASRDLRYAASHVLDESEVYQAMTDDDARIVLLKAAAIALRLQARTAAIEGEMVEYAFGDERVKRAVTSDQLASAADVAEADYETALARAIGPVGMRASYTRLGR